MVFSGTKWVVSGSRARIGTALVYIGVTVALLALAGVAEAASSSWTPETRLSEESGEAFTPKVAMSHGNEAVAVWQHRANSSSSSAIQSSSEHHGGS
jgi:hypothetical protein